MIRKPAQSIEPPEQVLSEWVMSMHQLSIGYRAKVLHQNLNLPIVRGELTCLLGPNGAGKTTLLRTLGGFHKPLDGQVMLLGKNMSLYSVEERSQHIGVVLTDKIHAGGLSVYELVALGRHPHTGFFGLLQDSDHRIIQKAIVRMGLTDLAHNYLSELSDGERQKAMIAKTLAQESQIILLDEPTAFLDAPSRIEIMALLHELASEQKKSVLISTHDLDLAIQMADRLWLMARDKPVASGTPEDLILSGIFASYFERNGISFDVATGNLQRERNHVHKVTIRGRGPATQWLRNALVRNGFQPESDVSETGISIESCHLKQREYILSLPHQPTQTLFTVEEVIIALNHAIKIKNR